MLAMMIYDADVNGSDVDSDDSDDDCDDDDHDNVGDGYDDGHCDGCDDDVDDYDGYDFNDDNGGEDGDEVGFGLVHYWYFPPRISRTNRFFAIFMSPDLHLGASQFSTKLPAVAI